jgi:hypothetical protein
MHKGHAQIQQINRRASLLKLGLSIGCGGRSLVRIGKSYMNLVTQYLIREKPGLTICNPLGEYFKRWISPLA